MEDTFLAAVATAALVFVVGAVFGRLHGADGARLGAVGDRVMWG